MNGQPTAQNTRECGANGDMPAFLNWQNPAHIQYLARHWRVDPSVIPHWFRHTHAMQIFRYCEQGAIRLLWISGTNPAVSLPELGRIRSILGQDRSAISRLHQSEKDLADEYGRVADRHAVEHDVYHMCHLLAEQCQTHAERLRPFVERYGASVRGVEPPELWGSLMGTVRRKNAGLPGRSPKTGLLLLRDLRQLYLLAGEAEINWWMVRQGAMAARETELAELFESCHASLPWLRRCGTGVLAAAAGEIGRPASRLPPDQPIQDPVLRLPRIGSLGRDRCDQAYYSGQVGPDPAYLHPGPGLLW